VCERSGKDGAALRQGPGQHTRVSLGLRASRGAQTQHTLRAPRRHRASSVACAGRRGPRAAGSLCPTRRRGRPLLPTSAAPGQPGVSVGPPVSRPSTGALGATRPRAHALVPGPPSPAPPSSPSRHTRGPWSDPPARCGWAGRAHVAAPQTDGQPRALHRAIPPTAGPALLPSPRRPPRLRAYASRWAWGRKRTALSWASGTASRARSFCPRAARARDAPVRAMHAHAHTRTHAPATSALAMRAAGMRGERKRASRFGE